MLLIFKELTMRYSTTDLKSAIAQWFDSVSPEAFYPGIMSDVAFQLRIAPNNQTFRDVWAQMNSTQTGSNTVLVWFE